MASGVWGILGNMCLELDLPFVSLSFPYQVVWGALYIEAVIKKLWGDVGLFLVTTTVTHGVLFTYPPTPPPPSELWLERRIANNWFRFFRHWSPPLPQHTHTNTPNYFILIGRDWRIHQDNGRMKISLDLFSIFNRGVERSRCGEPLFAPWWLWWFLDRWKDGQSLWRKMM